MPTRNGGHYDNLTHIAARDIWLENRGPAARRRKAAERKAQSNKKNRRATKSADDSVSTSSADIDPLQPWERELLESSYSG